MFVLMVAWFVLLVFLLQLLSPPPPPLCLSFSLFDFSEAILLFFRSYLNHKHTHIPICNWTKQNNVSIQNLVLLFNQPQADLVIFLIFISVYSFVSFSTVVCFFLFFLCVCLLFLFFSTSRDSHSHSLILFISLWLCLMFFFFCLFSTNSHRSTSVNSIVSFFIGATILFCSPSIESIERMWTASGTYLVCSK